jgi:hypothetical protein
MRHGVATLIAIAVVTPLKLEAQFIQRRVESVEQVALTFMLPSGSPVPPAEAQSRFSTAPASIAGSALGLFAGSHLGSALRRATGCCFEGGDDPGLAEEFLGAMVGATVGSALLGWVSDDRKPRAPGNYFTGAVIGIIPGVVLGGAGAWLFDNIDSDLPRVGLALGFSVGQGAMTALIGSR